MYVSSGAFIIIRVRSEFKSCRKHNTGIVECEFCRRTLITAFRIGSERMILGSHLFIDIGKIYIESLVTVSETASDVVCIIVKSIIRDSAGSKDCHIIVFCL